ncbi:NAD(P)-binding protein [Auricularia subglabra TFB-10046 SS5]|nr:NAD(P)-binding protein [Auricularia subglabra TFB-10046 SS5]
MTVSTDTSVPLVVVVGATGTQGGSVIRHLVESDRPYRLRGLTRDTSKAAALKPKDVGVEIIAVTIFVGNEAAVLEAFKGAEIVFAVTNFWEHLDSARETAEGKLMVDAAKAVGAKLFVWSGLEDITKGTGGKYTHAYHLDSKAAVTAYANSRLPTVEVQAGFYATNLENPLIGPRRLDDGSFVWQHPLAQSEIPQPYMDIEHDYGLFVRYAIESPEYRTGGNAIYSYGEFLTHSQAAEIIAQEHNTKVVIEALSVDSFVANVKAGGAPQMLLDDVRDLALFGLKFGYYLGKESSTEQKKVREGLARRPRTFEEFLRAKPDFLNS